MKWYKVIIDWLSKNKNWILKLCFVVACVVLLLAALHWHNWLSKNKNWITQLFLGIVGTIVSIAAFRSDLKNWFLPPEIIIDYAATYPYITQSNLFNPTTYSTKCFYFHARVSNTRHTTAKDCTVELSKIWTQRFDGNDFEERKNYIPAVLKWATIEEATTFIHRNQNRYIDIGYIIGERWRAFFFDRDKAIKLAFLTGYPTGLVSELQPKDHPKE